MPIELIIDKREQKILEVLKDSKSEVLDIGDIQYINTETSKIVCIVERKTLDDLSSSIMDGRYKEQKSRLLASGHKIVYLLEGVTKNKHGIPYNTLISASLNMQFRDRITVIRTKDLHETINILVLLKDKLKIFDDEEQNDNKNIRYDPNIQKVKKNNITKQSVYKAQLSCIPGISDKTADDIMRKFSSMKILVEHYNNEETVSGQEKMLTSIHGIGNIISKKVYEYMFNHAT